MAMRTTPTLAFWRIRYTNLPWPQPRQGHSRSANTSWPVKWSSPTKISRTASTWSSLAEAHQTPPRWAEPYRCVTQCLIITCHWSMRVFITKPYCGNREVVQVLSGTIQSHYWEKIILGTYETGTKADPVVCGPDPTFRSKVTVERADSLSGNHSP